MSQTKSELTIKSDKAPEVRSLLGAFWTDFFPVLARVRFWILLVAHTLIFALTCLIAFMLRFEFQLDSDAWELMSRCVLPLIGLKLVTFYLFRQLPWLVAIYYVRRPTLTRQSCPRISRGRCDRRSFLAHLSDSSLGIGYRCDANPNHRWRNTIKLAVSSRGSQTSRQWSNTPPQHLDRHQRTSHPIGSATAFKSKAGLPALGYRLCGHSQT